MDELHRECEFSPESPHPPPPMPQAPSPFRRRPSATRLAEWREWLDEAADRFERPDFIQDDPLGIPHGFDDPDDRAIAGFLSATLAWGNRKSILRLGDLLTGRGRRRTTSGMPMPRSQTAEGFVHRTFQGEDALRFVHGLRSLEEDGGLRGVCGGLPRGPGPKPARASRMPGWR